MEFFGKFWPLILAAGVVGAFFAPIIGYLRGQSSGNGGRQSPTIHGAAIVDSSVITALVEETAREAKAVERMAVVMEAILRQMTKTAADEAERARIEAAVAAEREKWKREHDRDR